MTPNYDCPEIQKLNRVIADAEKLKGDAIARQTRLDAARQALGEAEDRHAAEGTDASEQAVIEATARVRELEAVASVTARNGGPDGLRSGRLRTQANFDVLKAGLRRKEEHTAEALQSAREELGKRFLALTLEGVHFSQFAIVPDVCTKLLPRVTALEGALHAVRAHASEARLTSRKDFDALFNVLTAPIPHAG